MRERERESQRDSTHFAHHRRTCTFGLIKPTAALLKKLSVDELDTARRKGEKIRGLTKNEGALFIGRTLWAVG